MIVQLLDVYRRWISPTLHSISGAAGACRFQPTCSEYAAVAVERHGACRGLALAIWRLLRCTPLSRGGFDPVPDTLHKGELRSARREGANKARGRERLHCEALQEEAPCHGFGTDRHRHLP